MKLSRHANDCTDTDAGTQRTGKERRQGVTLNHDRDFASAKTAPQVVYFLRGVASWRLSFCDLEYGVSRRGKKMKRGVVSGQLSGTPPVNG